MYLFKILFNKELNKFNNAEIKIPTKKIYIKDDNSDNDIEKYISTVENKTLQQPKITIKVHNRYHDINNNKIIPGLSSWIPKKITMKLQ